MVMTCNQARLFRRGAVCYQGRVHNQPVYESPLGVLPHQMHLLHHGYDKDRCDQQAKFHRQRELLLAQLADTPDDPQIAFYLCQLYGNHGRVEESIRWGERYLARRQELGESFNPTILFTLASAHGRQGDSARAMDLIRLGLAGQPQNPDLACALADFAEASRETEALADGCRRYLRGYQRWLTDPAALGPQFFFSLRPEVHQRLALRLCLITLRQALEPEGADAGLAENLKALGMEDLASACDPMPDDYSSPGATGFMHPALAAEA
jgi:hypothetical protein